MPSRTNLKLAELIRFRASHVILFELKDPRMGFVTITKVDLAPDLETTTIFWSVIGDAGQRSKTAHALEHARLFVQRRVAEGVKTRKAPQLHFVYDESVEGSVKMGNLLKQLKSGRGETADDVASPEGVPAEGSTDPSAEDADLDEEDGDEEEGDEEEGEEEVDEESDDDSGDPDAEPDASEETPRDDLHS